MLFMNRGLNTLRSSGSTSDSKIMSRYGTCSLFTSPHLRKMYRSRRLNTL